MWRYRGPPALGMEARTRGGFRGRPPGRDLYRHPSLSAGGGRISVPNFLTRLGDAMRNSALVLRITLPSIGGLKKIRGHMAEFRLEPGGIAAMYWRP